MRRIVSLILAASLTVAGGGGLLCLLVLSRHLELSQRLDAGIVVAFAAMFGIGLMWLYSDLTDAAPGEDL
jgi:hypothetical protein